MSQVENFAHRGASAECPENTMTSFRRATELGATGIETDVQMTKDGKLILIHDETLMRTTGAHAFVKDLTLEEIKKLDAGSWFGPQFRNERIPTLDEFFKWMAGLNTYINIEIKSGIVFYPGIEEKVVEAIRQYHLTERTIISSFNHYSLVDVKRMAPEMKIGLLCAEALFEPWIYANRLNASALHLIQYAVLPQFVEASKKHGLMTNAFTVNELPDMKRMIAAGVDGIITDYPGRFTALLTDESNPS